MNITKELFQLRDLAYRDFHAKLMPNIAKDKVIGVRTPVLRKFAKSIAENTEAFFENLPHTYYEENNLHAFLISEIKDYKTCVEQLQRFLTYVDNWATCDGIRPKCFKNHRKELLTEIKKWLQSNHPYTVRFAIEMLMVHYLEEDFQPKYLQMVADVYSEEYYVKMMVAWYFATALAKQWDNAVWYLENNSLSPWVHNKTIQKAVESYRITPKQKEYLKTLKGKWTA